jgi:hypothetical protein
MKVVDEWVRARKEPTALHVGVEDNCGDVGEVWLVIPAIDVDVPEAVEGDLGLVTSHVSSGPVM